MNELISLNTLTCELWEPFQAEALGTAQIRRGI